MHRKFVNEYMFAASGRFNIEIACQSRVDRVSIGYPSVVLLAFLMHTESSDAHWC